jgi:hypothetical protein
MYIMPAPLYNGSLSDGVTNLSKEANSKSLPFEGEVVQSTRGVFGIRVFHDPPLSVILTPSSFFPTWSAE